MGRRGGWRGETPRAEANGGESMQGTPMGKASAASREGEGTSMQARSCMTCVVLVEWSSDQTRRDSQLRSRRLRQMVMWLEPADGRDLCDERRVGVMRCEQLAV